MPRNQDTHVVISAAPGKPVLALTLARPCSDCDIALEKGSTTLGPRRLMREGDIDMRQQYLPRTARQPWLLSMPPSRLSLLGPRVVDPFSSAISQSLHGRANVSASTGLPGAAEITTCVS